MEAIDSGSRSFFRREHETLVRAMYLIAGDRILGAFRAREKNAMSLEAPIYATSTGERAAERR